MGNLSTCRIPSRTCTRRCQSSRKFPTRSEISWITTITGMKKATQANATLMIKTRDRPRPTTPAPGLATISAAAPMILRAGITSSTISLPSALMATRSEEGDRFLLEQEGGHGHQGLSFLRLDDRGPDRGGHHRHNTNR